jgi:hypothetical protein
MSILQERAINSTVARQYIDGDQYQVETRLPEIGAEATFRDGRKYVFCSSAISLAAGDVVGSGDSLAEVTANLQSAYAAGETVIGAVVTSTAANAYAGGTLTVSLGTGLGYTYKIKSNTATDAGATPANTVLFTLEEGVEAPIAITDNLMIKPNRHAKLSQGSASTDNVGVMIGAITSVATKTQYFWVQTGGVGITKGTAGSTNKALMAAASGAAVAATAGNKIVATGLKAGASHSLCFLCFDDA